MVSRFRGISAEKLALLAGDGWQDFCFGRDGLFYLPGWRRGFEPAEIKAMFFQVQQVRALENKSVLAVRDAEMAIAAQHEAEKRAAWYRGQLVLESRMGMALARITG